MHAVATPWHTGGVDMDISRFALVNQVSGGRYGAIWKAHDPDLGRDVAIKQLALAGPEQYPRIIAEAESAGRLRHPNIVETYPPATDERTIWLVEQWVDGASLAVLTPPHAQLTVPQRLGVLRGALEGLAYAHRNGVVHGSVSPRTILVAADGTPRLVEFAAWLGHPDAAGIGAYASPEAFAGEQLIPASDVYSVGALLSAIAQDPGANEPTATGSLGDDLQPVVDRAMANEPSDRHPDAQALLDDLDRAARRSFGPVWWTTEGLGAIAASAAGATFASGTAAAGGVGAVAGTSAAAGSGGFGAVAGSMNLQGAGAIGGATGPTAGGGALAGSVKQASRGLGRKGIIAIVAGGAALVIVAASAVALTRGDNTLTAEPGAGSSVPAASAPPSGAAPSATTPTPTPTPTPKPNPAKNFQGTYRYVSVVTKSTSASEPVGSRQTAVWSAETTCKGRTCTTKVNTGTGGKETLTSTSGAWNTRVRGKAQCVNIQTQVPTGQKVPNLYTRSLKPTKAKAGQVFKITGTDRYRQLKKCRNQQIKNYDVTRKITITYQD